MHACVCVGGGEGEGVFVGVLRLCLSQCVFVFVIRVSARRFSSEGKNKVLSLESLKTTQRHCQSPELGVRVWFLPTINPSVSSSSVCFCAYDSILVDDFVALILLLFQILLVALSSWVPNM